MAVEAVNLIARFEGLRHGGILDRDPDRTVTRSRVSPLPMAAGFLRYHCFARLALYSVSITWMSL